jgi:glutaredoxin-related protein
MSYLTCHKGNVSRTCCNSLRPTTTLALFLQRSSIDFNAVAILSSMKSGKPFVNIRHRLCMNMNRHSSVSLKASKSVSAADVVTRPALAKDMVSRNRPMRSSVEKMLLELLASVTKSRKRSGLYQTRSMEQVSVNYLVA